MEDSFCSPSRLKISTGAENERMVLLKILSSHWEALEKHDSDNNSSQKQRWELWDLITNEFNAHPSVSHIRTVLQVKTLFKNMKTKAKKYQIRMEDSRLTGRIVESDAVSEIMLKVIAAQSAGSTRAVIDALKNGLQEYPEALKPKANGLWNKLIDEDSQPFYSENHQNSSLDGVTDIKIEAEDTFENGSETDGLLGGQQRDLTTPERILNSVSVSMTSPDSPTDVHTFGDISVTPIKDKGSSVAPLSDTTAPPLAVVPIISENVIAAARLLGFLKQKVSETNGSLLKRPSEQVPLLESGGGGKKQRGNSVDSGDSCSWPNSSDKTAGELQQQQILDNHTRGGAFCSSSSNISDNKGPHPVCCCPEFHKQSLAMVRSEHAARMAVLQQELELRQLETSVKEREKESQEVEANRRDVEFKARKEESKAQKVEHLAKMRLLQLEIEVAQARSKGDRSPVHKWQMINGSKEI